MKALFKTNKLTEQEEKIYYEILCNHKLCITYDENGYLHDSFKPNKEEKQVLNKVLHSQILNFMKTTQLKDDNFTITNGKLSLITKEDVKEN
jgi:hypothetical protein